MTTEEQPSLLTPESETPESETLSEAERVAAEHLPASNAQIVRGLPFGQYCDLDRVNATTLLTYQNRSACEARHLQLYDIKQTEALMRGHAAHAAVLEPEVFERDFATMPAFGDFRKTANKEKRDAWLEEHKDSIALPACEHDTVIAMRNSVLDDKFVGTLFSGAGLNELTLTWTDEETKLPCKARIDRITHYHGYETLVDLKTARDIDNRSCQKAMANYNYHIRVAWYLDALNLVQPGNFRVMFVWVLNRPPYIARVTELEDDGLREGRLQYRALLRKHADCLAANHWPGFAEGVEPLDLPSWAFEKTSQGGFR